MKIALDAMGGDHAPAVNIIGAREALARFPQITHIYLVGDQAVLAASCSENNLNLGARVSIVHASQTVEMHESGAKSLRSKRDSSISVATSMVKNGEAEAVVSAGNTGAAVAAATVKLRLLKGVERAGISSGMPNEHGLCSILDAGANPEAKPSHLLAYAVMGAVYAKEVLKVDKPVVGLMSNGEEDEKGTSFTKGTFALIRKVEAANDLPFTFKGNVEGHDLFESKLDVVLCDGFTGNIVLKSCEATAKAMSKWIKEEIKSSPISTVGGLLARGAFAKVKERTSYESYGGSPLLGVNGVCIIAHGGSSAVAIENALRVAAETIEQKVNPQIEKALAALA